MIVDTLEKLALYEGLNPLFGEVVEFLKNNDLDKLELGKHQIKGDDLYLNVTMAKGKTPDEAVLETHKKMIDIQIPLSGAETYGYTPLCNLPEMPYNEEKDIAFYIDQPTAYTRIYPGQFAIYFPEDGHAPGIGQGNIRKVIVKVQVEP